MVSEINLTGMCHFPIFFIFLPIFIQVSEDHMRDPSPDRNDRVRHKDKQNEDHANKGNNKITELRTILQRESQNS